MGMEITILQYFSENRNRAILVHRVDCIFSHRETVTMYDALHVPSFGTRRWLAIGSEGKRLRSSPDSVFDSSRCAGNHSCQALRERSLTFCTNTPNWIPSAFLRCLPGGSSNSILAFRGTHLLFLRENGEQLKCRLGYDSAYSKDHRHHQLRAGSESQFISSSQRIPTCLHVIPGSVLPFD